MVAACLESPPHQLILKVTCSPSSFCAVVCACVSAAFVPAAVSAGVVSCFPEPPHPQRPISMDVAKTDANKRFLFISSSFVFTFFQNRVPSVYLYLLILS